jgi:hypothetical protein
MRNILAQATKYAAKPKQEHARGVVMRGLLGTATVAAFVGAMSGSASVEPDLADDGTTEANAGATTPRSRCPGSLRASRSPACQVANRSRSFLNELEALLRHS